MASINLLYKDSFDINDKIHVMIPKVGAILRDEDGYYSLVSTLTAMPRDMMVQLDDYGIDCTTINEYDLFLMLFNGMREQDTSLIFGDLDLTLFEPAVNESNDTLVLLDRKNDIVIDRAIHNKIALVMRTIHHLEKNTRKPANEESKKYLLERERLKQARNKKKKHESQLEQLIVAMVNTKEFKYDYEGTRELSIYQFNQSVRQIINKVDYDNRMIGIYTGNLNAKELSQDDLNWLTHK